MKDTQPRGHVDVVRRAYDAFARRDFDTILGLLAPDVEILQSAELPWGGAYRGHDGAREFFGKLTAAIDATLVLDRFIDAGDHVIAIGHTQGTAHASGARYDVPLAHLWTVAGARVRRVAFYVDNPAMLAVLEPLSSKAIPRDEGPVDEAG